MKPFARATMIALLWALASDQVAAQRSDTTVVRVGAPLHAGMGTLSEELTLGQGSAAVEYQFTMPYVYSGPARGVFVVDVSNPMGGQYNTTIRLYDSTGKFVRAFGRTGQGPGEYSGIISDVKHLPDGRVLVATRGGVIVYAATGRYLAQWLPSVSIKVTIRNGRLVDSLAPPEPKLPGPTMLAGGPLQFAPRHLVKWNSLGYFVTVNTANYAVDLRVPRARRGASTSTAPWVDGDPVISIRRTVATIPLSAAERADWRQSLTMYWRRQSSKWEWDGPEIPLVKPAITALQMAADGRIWVRASQPSILNPAVTIRNAPGREAFVDIEAARRWVEPWVYDVFEPSGQHVGQVRFPDTPTPVYGFRFDYAMDGDTVWGVVYEKDDVPSVKRYRIKWERE